MPSLAMSVIIMKRRSKGSHRIMCHRCRCRSSQQRMRIVVRREELTPRLCLSLEVAQQLASTTLTIFDCCRYSDSETVERTSEQRRTQQSQACSIGSDICGRSTIIDNAGSTTRGHNTADHRPLQARRTRFTTVNMSRPTPDSVVQHEPTSAEDCAKHISCCS